MNHSENRTRKDSLYHVHQNDPCHGDNFTAASILKAGAIITMTTSYLSTVTHLENDVLVTLNIILVILTSLPASESQTCPQIILPPYAKFLQGQPCPTYTGARCYLTCELNFDLIGSCFRTCGQSGQWSGVNIICTRPSVTCPPLQIPPGVILKSGCQNMAGFSCEFGCASGSPPIGPANIYCQVSGLWSGPVPSCRTDPVYSCPPLPPPVNGRFTTGSCPAPGNKDPVCTIACNPGYNPSPSPIITCGTNGAWSGPVPQCLPIIQCPVLTIENGFINVGNCGQAPSVPGATCGLMCNTGYSATGPTQLQCTNNGWLPPPPKCNPSSCPPLNAPLNGQISGQCIPGLPGRICQFRCLPGFKIQGSDTLTCTNGKWSGTTPTCILAGCAPLPVPQGGLWKFGNVYQPNFECPGDLGSVCELICGNGFILQGAAATRCVSDGSNVLRWDPVPTPTCAPAG